MIDDEKIIELFFERSEQAIRELDIKYGKICHNLSYNIVNSRQDAEECVNDAYLGAWNAIPPVRPNPLLSYIVKIVRNISLKIYWRKEAAKRSGHYTIALEEIEGCIADQKTVEDEIEARELARIIEAFLDTLTVKERVIFMRRYAYADTYADIAKRVGIYLLPENEVKTSDIDGTAVTFGYRSMPYGPYNPDTHEPSGYYDMYVAEFEYDGIEYQIVAEQMEAEEVVKVVSSIIYGEEVIVDK